VRVLEVGTEGNVAVAQIEGEWDVTRAAVVLLCRSEELTRGSSATGVGRCLGGNGQ
jgi:hypothetical protein